MRPLYDNPRALARIDFWFSRTARASSGRDRRRRGFREHATGHRRTRQLAKAFGVRGLGRARSLPRYVFGAVTSCAGSLKAVAAMPFLSTVAMLRSILCCLKA
jgi:hypothetical protein